MVPRAGVPDHDCLCREDAAERWAVKSRSGWGRVVGLCGLNDAAVPGARACRTRIEQGDELHAGKSAATDNENRREMLPCAGGLDPGSPARGTTDRGIDLQGTPALGPMGKPRTRGRKHGGGGTCPPGSITADSSLGPLVADALSAPESRCRLACVLRARLVRCVAHRVAELLSTLLHRTLGDAAELFRLRLHGGELASGELGLKLHRLL
jgi:hypothetical protein